MCIRDRFWCTQCLDAAYITEEKLKEHQKLCFKHESVKVNMPKPDTDKSKVFFKNKQNQFKHPFYATMDFESTLVDKEKKIGEKSHIYQKHVPNSCGIKLNCDDNTYSMPIKIFNNSNPEKLIEDVILDLEKKS